MLRLTLTDFAALFATSVDTFSDATRELVDGSDFSYRRLAPDERDRTLLEVLKKIDAADLSVSGPHRQSDWEKGWAANLETFVESGYDLSALTPGYYRPNRILRLDRDYVCAGHDAFELNVFRVLRAWLFERYLGGATAGFEFGCGTGYNLPPLAQRYPATPLHGLDWARASGEIVNAMAARYGWQMTGHRFDMFAPDRSLEVPRGSAFLTFGGLEQLGEHHGPFVDFILEKAPAVCVHVEPIAELYDSDDLLDHLALRFHQRRGYLMNFLIRLTALQREGRAELLHVRRVRFGGMFHDGWSMVVWRPARGE